MYDKLFTRLLKTRDRLSDVCEELGMPMPNEEDMQVLQCADCYIWRAKNLFVIESGAPVCSFCQDMILLRF